AALAALRAAAPDLRTSDYERAFHAVGKSYFDLLRARAGALPGVPDAVAYPASHDEVQSLLQTCAERRIAVVPYGAGSSVVGGVEARRGSEHAGVLTVDLCRMDRLLDLDELSHTATFEAGIYGPELEAALTERGFTMGHFPQSFEFSTLGGWIAARGAGMQSNRYGTAAEMLSGARLATPRGEWRTKPFPQSAAGPDLNHLIAGSEGTLGVITEATVKIHPLAEQRDFISFLFRDWESGALAIRKIVQSELPVATMRLSDEAETHFYGTFRTVLQPSRTQDLAQKALGYAGFDKPCVLMVGFEGPRSVVKPAWRTAFATCTKLGGLFVGRGPGKSWHRTRFETPYLRDLFMDRGIGVDTLETSTTWANVHRLHAAVSDAIRGAMQARGDHGIVMGHISHSYLDGASLYFTFVFARDLTDEIGQWLAIKEAASNVISNNGGTISHHHGVGVDHTRWMTPEKGPLGLGTIAGAKRELDPGGIMNPGKLLP
ncbi:MAG: FAD-binding oxidoreductase, partial [Sandaracinaceae bacterium]|nr:FAD-binding oxidoreductase [Sandaracinaceae bacterium]